MGIEMKKVKDAQRIVIKVGTSTLTHRSGRLNLKLMDRLAMVLSDIKNSGREVVLVTSGAVTAGMNKMGLKERPKEIKEKQAPKPDGDSAQVQQLSLDNPTGEGVES